jgi:hypothetical protein
VVKKHLDHHEAVVAADGMLKRRVLPLSSVIGIGAVAKGEGEAFVVVPVGFAGGKPGERALVAAAGFEQDFDDSVVVGFRSVVTGLSVVGIGAVLKQEAGEAGVLGEASGAVKDGFQEGLPGVVGGVDSARDGAGSGVEQGASGRDEGIGARFVETEVAGESEIG